MALKYWFQSATFVCTWLEISLVCALLSLAVGLVYETQNATFFPMAMLFFINPLCALYYALRLKPTTGRWLVPIELWLLICITLLYVIPVLVLMRLAIKFLEYETVLSPAILVITPLFIFPFLFFRITIRLWLWWERIRQYRLIWSLVHSHLITAILFQSIVALPALLFVFFSPTYYQYAPENPLGEVIFRLQMVLPMVGLGMLGATVVLTLLLPVSISVSYFFARRIRRRLDTLVQASRTARDGHYTTRVVVTGKDELAQLQTDFNIMTANLESTITALRHEQETVQRLLHSRREMMVTVSHELRTPIATIRAYLESALRQQSTDDLPIIQHEVDRLQTLIDDLFALSQAEVDQLTLKPSAVDAVQLIQQVVQTVAPLAWRVNRVEVVNAVPNWLPLLRADTARLEQILRNLLHNSLRYTPPGGLIVISARNDTRFAHLEVRDSGEGIAPDDLPHIWERYYRDSEHGGSGLGLALVKSFTESMSGTVSVESTIGVGSTFTISLPLFEPQLPSTLPTPQPVPRYDNFATNSRK